MSDSKQYVAVNLELEGGIMKSRIKQTNTLVAQIITKITIVIFACLVYFSAIATSNAYVVRNILVNGNQKISRQTIIDHLGVSAGQDIDNSNLDIAVKNLFALGYFSDVHVKHVGNSLVVTVSEAKTVNQIFFQGNKKIKSKMLEKILTLKPSEAFNHSKLLSDVRTIKDAYKSVGLNDVEVDTRTVDAGNGTVNVVFDIKEVKQATVKQIVFVGNNIFSQSRLRDVINTKETGLFSWLTHNDVYNAERLNLDSEALKQFYFNHGYADFRVLSTNASLIPGTNSYRLTFVVSEGVKYKFGAITVESSINSINVDPLYSSLRIKPGEVYNASRIDDATSLINDKIAVSGYAFAKVEAHTNHNFADHTISIIFSIDQGPRLYVQRIDIKGNTRTKDYVIRREFTFGEGDALNATSVRRVKHRLEALGFFSSVDITTEPGSASDQVILVVNVVESSTGEFSVGGGYTTGGATPGASFDASIAENNFLGRGQYIRLGASLGQDSARSFNFSFTEPYFMGYHLPVGIDLFHTKYTMDNSYDVVERGFSPRVDVPITDNLTANLTYNYVKENYNLGKAVTLDELKKQYAGAIVKSSQKHWLRSSLEYGLTYNSLDNMVIPREGFYAKIMQEYAGIGGDARFFKTYGKLMSYNTLSEKNDIVALLSAGAGIVHENKTNGARIFDLFQNDNSMIRGFKYNGIGPREKSGNGETFFIGGSKYMNATAELQYPLPFVSDSLGMRGAVFVDAGTIYDNPYKPEKGEEEVTDNKMRWRASGGISLIWASPLGPLRFDYALPIKKVTGDLLQRFNFGVSTKF